MCMSLLFFCLGSKHLTRFHVTPRPTLRHSSQLTLSELNTSRLCSVFRNQEITLEDAEDKSLQGVRTQPFTSKWYISPSHGNCHNAKSGSRPLMLMMRNSLYDSNTAFTQSFSLSMPWTHSQPLPKNFWELFGRDTLTV